MTDSTIMRLDDAKALKKRKRGSHGEGCEDIDDQTHRIKSLQMGLSILCLSFFRSCGASQLVIFSMPIGMPIITATLWTGSKASAGWRPHHASAMAMFVVSTVRWASEIGSAFSQLLKDRIDRLMGILSTNHELYVL